MQTDLQCEPNLPSSPPSLPSRSSKPKRPPPITPRRFNRFFDARSSRETHTSGRSGRILKDLTSNSTNRIAGNNDHSEVPESDDLPSLRSNKRKRYQEGVLYTEQKIAHNEAPLRSTPVLRSSPVKSSPLRSSPPCSSPFSKTTPNTRRTLSFQPFPQPIQRSRSSPSTNIDFRHETGNFCTTPEDAHQLIPPALPFCIASCNSKSFFEAY